MEKLCQSCGMPLGAQRQSYGTEKDGSPNGDYCIYCYRDGDFTADLTMEEMMNTCIPFMAAAYPDLAPAKARAMMTAVLPHLKRWGGCKAKRPKRNKSLSAEREKLNTLSKKETSGERN